MDIQQNGVFNVYYNLKMLVVFMYIKFSSIVQLKLKENTNIYIYIYAPNYIRSCINAT